MAEMGDPLVTFIEAACVPLDRGHASGTLECAEAILAAHPEVASSSIHAAAILGDDAVRACVDSYWADRRSPESVQALLQAGASVNGVPFPSGYAEVDELLKTHGAIA